MRLTHVVFYSGGVASWQCAKRLVDNLGGPEDVRLLFTDTLVEDESTYRFLQESAADVGAELIRIADGRTPFEVYRDARYLGNARTAHCSIELKRKTARKWVEAMYPRPDDVTLYLGMTFDEGARLERARKVWAPYKIESTLMDEPFVIREGLIALAEAAGLTLPTLYKDGFLHANCGGACCRAGQGQWKHLQRVRPEVYKRWEDAENDLRDYLDADVSMLRDRTGGTTTTLTLTQLRHREESQVDLFEWGGCGCMVDDDG